jgi:hypothetical protein
MLQVGATGIEEDETALLDGMGTNLHSPPPHWACFDQNLYIHEHLLILLTSSVKIEAAYIFKLSTTLPIYRWYKYSNILTNIKKI